MQSLAQSAICECAQQQTKYHTADTCPLTKFEDGWKSLHEVDASWRLHLCQCLRNKWPVSVTHWSLAFVQPGAKVDSSYYCDVVLNQRLLPDIQKLSGNNFTFQQHGAPAHRSQQTVAFLHLHVREFIEPEIWPPNSPDLNPVDYFDVWELSNSLFTVVVAFETLSTWKKSCNLLGADWSRCYRLR